MYGVKEIEEAIDKINNMSDDEFMDLLYKAGLEEYPYSEEYISKEYAPMLQELKELYPDTDFQFHTEKDSVQLLYNNKYYDDDDDDFFETVSDIALKYLPPDIIDIFAIIYDWSGEMEK